MIKIGSRSSKLALWQAHYLQEKLVSQDIESEIIEISTQGDRIQDLSFDKMEGKGFFTKEIEIALLSEEIDIAVHSMKDLETRGVEGLKIAGVSERANPQDCLLSLDENIIKNGPLELPKGFVIGTSSARRRALVKHYFNHTKLKHLRGNVPTRIQKLIDGKYDAIILARAGIDRLNIENDELFIRNLSPREFIPAPAQGVLAYQCRSDDKKVKKILASIHNSRVSELTNVERSVLKSLDGGCQLPLGVYCEKVGTHYRAHAAYKMNNGEQSNKMKIVRSMQVTTAGLSEDILDKLNVNYGEEE